MSDKVTPAQHLAAIAGLALASRQLKVSSDPEKSDMLKAAEMLHTLNDHMAFIGGAAMLLAEDMGIKEEVERRIKEGQDRIAAFIASQGLEGTA
ncbi:hypothetical protein [Paracoccus versutus]